MLVALGQVVAWRSRLPLAWEVATSAACMAAAVSSYLLLFERISWWDIPVHALLNGLLAVLVARVVRSDPSVVEIVVTGAILAVVWELMELAGHYWVDPSVEVAPADTALDLLAALVGSPSSRRGCGADGEPRSRRADGRAAGYDFQTARGC